MRCPSCNTYVEDRATSCWLCHATFEAPVPATPGPTIKEAALTASAPSPPGPPIPPGSAAPGWAAPGWGTPGAPPAWSPPASASPRRRTGKTVAIVLGSIVGAFVLLIAIGVVVAVVTDDHGDSTVQRYIDGKGGKEFTSAEGRFSAVYPSEPHRKTTDETLPDGSRATTVSYESQPGADHYFAVGFLDAPLGRTFSNTSAGLEGAAQGAASAGATIIDKSDTTFAGTPAKDVLFKRGSAYYRNRIFFVGDRLYIVAVGSRSQGERRDFDRFVSTVKITPT